MTLTLCTNLNGKVNAGLLVLIHVVLQLCLAQLVEGDDNQGNEDVDKEEREDYEEDDIEDCLLGSVPRDRTLVFVGGCH